MRCLLALLCCVGVAAAQEGLPKIFWVSQPVRSGQTVLLQGAGLVAGTGPRMTFLPDDEPGLPPAAELPVKELNWEPVDPLLATGASMALPLPRGDDRVTAVSWQRGRQSTRPVLVNAPEVWFVQGDQGDTASPGGWLGVFGTCLRLDAAAPRLALVAEGRPARVVTGTATEVGHDTGYGHYFRLPADLAPGRYTVYLHNGHGGPAAWTRYAGYAHGPLDSVTIAPRVVWPTAEFTVDPGADDDARLAAALARARANGGGVIVVPAGTLRLARPLLLPQRTLLRGQGRDVSTLEWTADPTTPDGRPLPLISGEGLPRPDGGQRAAFSLEDLTVRGGPTLGQCLVERSQTTIPAYLKRVRLVAPRQKSEREARPALQLNQTANFAVTDCDLDAFSCITVQYSSASYLRIAGNRLRWRGATINLLRDHQNVIIEDNRLTMAGTFRDNGYTPEQNPNPGLWWDAFDSSNVRDLYYAHNTSGREEAEPPHTCIGITFDGNGAAYFGRVTAVNGTHLTLAAPTNRGDIYNHPPCQPGAFVRIVAGRGMGQWRHLVSRATIAVTELEVDRPWDVEPDATSWLAVNGFQGRALFIENDFGNEPCLQTYFGSHDVIWAGNKFGLVGQRTTVPVWYGTIAGGMQSDWHYQVLDNEIRGDSVDLVTVNASFGQLPADYAGPLSLGHLYRGNWASGTSRFMLALPPRMDGFVVEGNRRLSELRTKDAEQSRGLLRYNSGVTDQALAATLPAGSGVVQAE